MPPLVVDNVATRGEGLGGGFKMIVFQDGGHLEEFPQTGPVDLEDGLGKDPGQTTDERRQWFGKESHEVPQETTLALALRVSE